MTYASAQEVVNGEIKELDESFSSPQPPLP
jgi:hypothetical protein